MKHIFRQVFLLLTFFSLIFSTMAEAKETEPSFDHIVIFGDSLSDDGNLYSRFLHLMPVSPPYYLGDFSNGEVWSDYLANYFDQQYKIKTENYAVGGEVIGFHFGRYLPWTLYDSISSYLLRNLFSDKSNTLYVIWVGGNDYLQSAANVDEYTKGVMSKFKENIERLIAWGGQHFLVLTIPDLSRTPQSRIDKTVAQLHALTMSHNEKLAAYVEELEKNKTDIHLYSIDKLFDELMSNTAKINKQYGIDIENSEDSCWEGGYTHQQLMAENDNEENRIAKDFEAQLAEKQNAKQQNFTTENEVKTQMNPKMAARMVANSPDLLEVYRVAQLAKNGVKACDHPDAYLFWDHVHPTKVVHKVLGSVITAFVNEHWKPIHGV